MSGARRTKYLMLLSALILFAVALLSTPQILLRLEIMENALTSQSELIRKGAQFEVKAVRTIAFVVAVGLALLSPFWSRIATSARYRAFMERKRPSLRDHRHYRRGFLNLSLAVMATAIVLVFLYLLTADSLLAPEQMLTVQREDGIFENGSALLLLAASLVSVGVALRLGRGRPEFYMHLFLAFLFFVMMGEEISWGQRLFGFETPEFIAAVNVQNETNFHNAYGYLFAHIFLLGFFIWGVVIPLLDRFAPFCRQLISAIGLPVPSGGLAVAMLAIFLMQPGIVYKFIDPFTDPSPRLFLPEPRELLTALAFFVLMLEVWVLVGRPLGERRSEEGSNPGISESNNITRR